MTMDGWPLTLAAVGGHKAAVRLLLDCGADVNVMDGDRYPALRLIAVGGYKAVVRLLQSTEPRCVRYIPSL
jgi:hypothetical protein